MPSSQLTQAEATQAMNAAIAKAEELGCLATITIAVVDADGHLVALERMDDRGFEVDIALAKAYDATALRRDGKDSGALLDSNPYWRCVPDLLAGRVELGSGGVLLRRTGASGEYQHGRGETVLGAIGVTGSSGDEDELIARAGAAAVR
jgi:uncharacterized protein GlcG (DUF336 family)